MGPRSRKQSKAIKNSVNYSLFQLAFLSDLDIYLKKKKKAHGRSGLFPQSPRNLLYFQRQNCETMKDSIEKSVQLLKQCLVYNRGQIKFNEWMLFLHLKQKLKRDEYCRGKITVENLIITYKNNINKRKPITLLHKTIINTLLYC